MSRDSFQSTSVVALQRVRALLADKQSISAELALRSLVQADPSCVEAWLLLAELAEQRGDEERVRECVAQASTKRPQDESLCLNIAHLQLRAGNLADGVDTLTNVLEQWPNSFMAWFMLGDAFDLAGLQDLAVRARFQG